MEALKRWCHPLKPTCPLSVGYSDYYSQSEGRWGIWSYRFNVFLWFISFQGVCCTSRLVSIGEGRSDSYAILNQNVHDSLQIKEIYYLDGPSYVEPIHWPNLLFHSLHQNRYMWSNGNYNCQIGIHRQLEGFGWKNRLHRSFVAMNMKLGLQMR